jgi:hypothetical protein
VSYPPPPQQTSTPSQSVNYPPPPTQASPSQYPPPPAQSSPAQYAPPPEQTPSPSYRQPGQTSYPPPPAASPQASPSLQQHSQQSNIPLRQASVSSSNAAPPPFEDKDSPYLPEKQGGPDPLQQSEASPSSSQGPGSMTLPANMISGAPPAGQFVGATATVDDVGTFNGGSYRISHRDCNTIVTIQLAVGCPLTAKPGEPGVIILLQTRTEHALTRG